MLQSQVKIPKVDANTHLVCASLSSTGCACSCASCQGCVDCVDCPGLDVTDIVMNVYRKGLIPDKQYFVQYPAYSLAANTVCFYIDDLLTEAVSGYYIGDVVVKGNACGSIQLNVDNACNVFAPYTV